MVKTTRGKKNGTDKARKTVQRKVKPSTKYKTGESDDYEGSCNQKQVKVCVKQGKYCNVDTNRCVLPKGVMTKVKKDSTLAADAKYGIVGKGLCPTCINMALDSSYIVYSQTFFFVFSILLSRYFL